MTWKRLGHTALAIMAENGDLKPFLLLAKNTKGAATAALIGQVLDHPGVNVFGELLDMPNVLELAGTPSNGSLELLRLFAYGTWSEYKTRAAELPELSEAQTTKLKRLTLVALAAQSKRLAYDVLMQELGLPGVRELEDLLIECMYAGLLQGRLDPETGHVEIFSCAGRDVHPDEIPHMAATLLGWQRNAAGLMTEVSEQLMSFKQQQEMARAAQKELDEKVEAVRTTLREQGGAADGFGGPGGLDGDARMDFEDDNKMRKSGRMKGRHVGPGGKHSARLS